MEPEHFKHNVCCADCQQSRWEPDRYKYWCLMHEFVIDGSEAEHCSCDDYLWGGASASNINSKYISE